MQPPPAPPPQGPYPGYAPAPPPKRSNTAVWVIVGVAILGGGCVVLAILAAILFPVFAQEREAAKKTTCLTNVKQQAMALIIYSSDNNDHFPGAVRWMDRIGPHVKDQKIFHCPSVKGGQAYGYAMSRAVAGKASADILDPEGELLVFESALPGRSAVGGPETMPSPGRHMHKNNVAYVDGSAGSGGP